MTPKTAERLNADMVVRLRADGFVRTPEVEAAFKTVLRSWFLPEVPLDRVYSGEAIPIAMGKDGLAISSSSEPGIMATMLDQLRIEPRCRVLEVGTGSGYNAALLHTLAPSGEVTTVDVDGDVVARSCAHLERAGFQAVEVVLGDGWLGVPARAPFDRIEATVGVWDISPHWVKQLASGGILVVPLWLRAGVQVSVALRNDENELRSVSVECCGFMRLRGQHAGPEAYLPVRGWVACLDEVRADDQRLLSNLLADDSRAEETPERADGWFERLALDEPMAIQLWTTEAPLRSMQGIFDRGERGLALVEGGELRSYGNVRAVARLKEHLASGRTVDLRALELRVVEPRREVLGSWQLRRTHYRYVLNETAQSDRSWA